MCTVRRAAERIRGARGKYFIGDPHFLIIIFKIGLFNNNFKKRSYSSIPKIKRGGLVEMGGGGGGGGGTTFFLLASPFRGPHISESPITPGPHQLQPYFRVLFLASYFQAELGPLWRGTSAPPAYAPVVAVTSSS